MPTEYDPFQRDCPSRQLLTRIGERWTMLVVVALADGKQRFSELARRLEGVSQKVLTQTLRALERDGFVSRTVYPVVPPKVEYDLTELGRSLLEPLSAIEEWAVANMGHVTTARQRYDAAG